MGKKFRSLAAVLLILVMIVQMIPASIFSAQAIGDASGNGAAVSVEEIDFSLKRLLVGTNDSSIFEEDTKVIAEYGDVYLLEFEDEDETKSAYTYYSEAAEFVDADVALFVADNESIDGKSTESANAVSGTQSNAKNNISKGHYDVAIIDTGVANGAAESVSVIGGDGVDDNGHGTAMLDAVKSVSDAVFVLSIKAFDSHGIGYLSDVYAAILCAIEQNVSVISMSFAAEMKTNGFVLEHAVAMAKEAGIIFVGAAGNDNANVSKYLPGRLNDVYIAGACDEDGVRLSTSNYGDNVTCNVVAGSTSEAAAKLAAIIALYGEDYISAEMNKGVLFEKSYGIPAEEHAQLVETEASNNSLLNKSELTAATLDAISGKPVASTNKTDTADEEPADVADETTDAADETTDTADEPADVADETTDAADEPADVADETTGVADETADTADDPADAADETTDVADETADTADEPADVADEPAVIADEPEAITDEPSGVDDPAQNTDEDEDDEDDEEDWTTPPSQDPDTVDNTTIERVYVRWQSTSAGEETPAYFGTLKLAPDSELVADQQFQIDFALSGQEPYEPGMIELTFPAYLWKDRYGKEPGYLTVAVPEDPTEGAEFVWKRVDNNIVITNSKTIPAASKVMIQGTFRGVVAPDMKDETSSLDFVDFGVTLTVETPLHNTITKRSNSIDAKIDTSVKATYANKTAYNSFTRTYDVWWEEIPDSIPNELLPKNPNNYAYIRWYVSGTAYGSQPFDMYVTDTVTDDYGGIMLGVSHCAQGNGTVKSTNNKTVTALLYHGYSTTAKTAYVWTAYPKDKFPEDEVVMIPNEQTISVVGWDDEIETTQKAESSVDTKSPTTYTFIKHWDDLDDAWEVRPTKLDLNILYEGRLWKTVTLTEADASDGGDNDWKYTWSDGGLAGTFDVSETMYDYYGVWEKRFDGTGHQLEWNYILVGTDYDPDTHTWIYTNRYDEGWIKFEISKIEKNVEYKFNDSSTVSSRDKLSLNKLLRNEDVLVEYPVKSHISVAKPSVWFGVKPNRFVLEDVEYILNDNTNLTVDDVSINAVTLENPVVWHYIENSYNEDGWYQRETVKAPEATLYGLMGEDNWVKMATLLDGKVTPVGENVTVTDMRVKLPNGVSRVKLELESDEAVVEMNYTVELRVRPTEPVLAMINSEFQNNDHLRFTLYNKANAYAIYLGEEEKMVDWIPYKTGDRVSDMSDIAIGYLHGRQFKVATDLEKKFELTGSDEVNKRVKLTAELTLTQQSNVNTISEYKDAIAEGEIPNTKSGVFYDLLPFGVDPDLTSIKAGDNDRIANAWVVENYKDSGRTLLVVKVEFEDNISNTEESKYPDKSTYPTVGYKNQHTIKFDSYCPWTVVANTSTGFAEMRNVAAYEADEQDIGTYTEWSGEPDDPTKNQHVLSSTAVGPDAELMTDLDPNRDDPSFVYAGAPLIYKSIDVQAITGLEKSVQAAGSGYWSKGLDNDVNVQEGGKYTYRLSVTSAPDTITQDIILLDSIENYMPQDSDDPKDIADKHWHGTLVSVDLAQAKKVGVAPVVYYSTVKNIDISEYAMTVEGTPDDVIEKLASSPDWSTEVSDLSQVTAVAIDLRNREDGSDFSLQSGESLTVYLHMRAPFEKDNPNPDYFKGTNGRNHVNNAHAYNDIYLNCLQVVHGTNTHAYIHNSYTKVGIYTKYIDVKKAWDDDNDRDGKRPGSIKVHLYADGVDTGEYVVLNDDNKWTGTFERMLTYNEEDGSYIDYTFVEEFDSKDEYQLKTKQEIRKNGSVLITLTNKHDPETIKIPITKLWDDENNNDKTRPSSIMVRLYADGKLYKTITITPDVDGNWYGEFTDLPKYRDKGQPIEYTITEANVDNYIPGKTEGDMDEGFTLNNIYYPFGDLLVKKVLEDETLKSADTEFTFTLLLTTKDENGNVIDETNKYKYTILDGDGKEIKSGEIGNGDEFVLKGGQTFHVKDIPTNVEYAVSEASTNGFEIIASNETGKISSWKPAEAVFKNKYSSKGNAQLEAMKCLYGRDLVNRQFRFELYDEHGNLLRTGYNDENGKVTFGQIGYTNKDDGLEFKYKISEFEAKNPGYTYDDTVYFATVIPHDNGDGTMTCEVKYYDAGGNELNITEGEKDYKVPVFRNIYEAKGSISFRAWKLIDGRDVNNEEFTFDIYDENFNYIGSAKNDGDGIINFEKFNFTEADADKTYWYYVREQVGTDKTVVYTDAILGYVVTVVDNGDGTLSFNQGSYDMTEAFSECKACDGTGKIKRATCETCNAFKYVLDPEWVQPDKSNVPVFYNGLVDGSLSISKYIDGGGDPYKEFKFKVKLIGEKIEDGEIEFEISAADSREFPNTSGYQAISTDTPVAQIPAGNENLDNENTDDEYSIMPLADTTWGISWSYSSGVLTIEPSNGVEGTWYLPPSPGSTQEYIWPWNSYQGSMTKVVTTGKIKLVGDARDLFRYCSRLTDISGLANWDVSEVTSLKRAFVDCTMLSDISPLKNWKPKKLETMEQTFYSCSRINSLEPLANWTTDSLISLEKTFSGCSGVQSLSGLENWKTSKVEKLNETFRTCKMEGVSELANWDTSSVKQMEKTFEACSALYDISPLGKWNVDNVETFSNMFSGCSVLDDISTVTDWCKEGARTRSFKEMFKNCKALKDLTPLKYWDMSNATSVEGMFNGCSMLKDLTPLKDWEITNTKSRASLFSNCSILTDLTPLKDWDMSEVTSMASMFSYCKALTDLSPIANWETTKLSNLSGTFAGCNILTDISPLANWSTENLTDTSTTFSGCYALTDLSPITNWNMLNVTTMEKMFQSCYSLTDLSPIAGWFKNDPGASKSMYGLFYSCRTLTSIAPLKDWKTSNVTNIRYMFDFCYELSDISAFANWDVSSVKNMDSVFEQCHSLSDITPMKDWDTSSVTSMTYMFEKCYSLSDASAIANWNTEKVTTINNLFFDCTSLTTVDFSGWNTANMTSYNSVENIFRNCPNVSKITFGENFFKTSKSFAFPTPDSTVSTGKWINENESDWPMSSQTTYSSAQLASNKMIGTFIWQYKDTSYDIDFEADEANGLMLRVKGSSVANYTLPRNGFTKPGCTFAGWQDKNDNTKNFALSYETGICTIPAGTYEAGAEVTLIPVWYENRHSAEIKEGEFELILHGGEKATFDNLPAGTIYQIWEETPNGWILIKTVDASGVIKPNETVAAEFYNLYQPNMTAATIIGTKTFDNLPAHQDNKGNAFAFELLENNRVIQTVNAKPGGFIQFNSITYRTEGTHTYTIREKVGSNADIQYDTHQETVIVTISRDDDGNMFATVEYDDDGAKFENRSIPGKLEISKVGEGMTESTKNPDFKFKVKLYNENGIPVDGEAIKWYVIDSETGEVVNNNTDPIVPDEEINNNASAPFGLVASAAVNENLDNKNTKNENSIATIADEERTVFKSGAYQGVIWTLYENFDDPSTYTLSVEPNQNPGPRPSGEYGNYRVGELRFLGEGAYYDKPWNSYTGKITAIETKNGKILCVGSANGNGNNPGIGFNMFGYYSILKDLSGLANWNVSNMSSLKKAFYYCKELESLSGLETWNVSNVNDMEQMFYECGKLTDLTALKSWYPSSMSIYKETFGYCKSIESLEGLENFGKANLTSLDQTFNNCQKLSDISALKGWNVSGVQSMNRLFCSCYALSDISVLASWTPYSLKKYDELFANCHILEDISPITNWTPRNNETTMDSMLSGCYLLSDLTPLKNWNTATVTSMGSLFSSCTNITDLSPLAKWNMSSITSIYNMFNGCTGIYDLSPLGNWRMNNTSVQVGGMFQNCTGITDISPLANWKPQSITGNASHMFDGCTGITDATPIADWIYSSGTFSCYQMFRNCSNLVVVDISKLNSAGWRWGESGRDIFSGCSKLSKLTIGEGLYNYTINTQVTLPTPNPNYTTGKWVREEEADWENPDAYTSAEIISNKMTGTFVWQYLPSMYTIHFDGNGASGSMISQKAAAAENYTLPNNTFLNPGNEFLGWQDKNDPDNYFAFKDGKCVIPEGTYEPGETITLEADWKDLGNPNLVPYYIYHYQQNTNLNGYDLADMEVKYAEIGTYVPVETKYYDGFVTPTQQADKKISANNVLNVKYNYGRIRYTIHFDGNGADFGSMANLTMIYGVGKVFGNGFSKTESAFLGWNTEPDGSGKRYSAVIPIQLPAQNGETITLYAEWATIDQSAEPSQGEIIVSCKAGQTIVIPDLPAGTTYEIEEINIPFGWVLENENDINGQISANKASQEIVTNLYNARGVGSIVAHKTLVGDALNAGAFTFELFDEDPENSDSALEPIQSVVNGEVDTVEKSTDENGDIVDNPWYGKASVVFDGLQFTEPGDYTYYIREKAGNDSTIVYDTHVEKVTVHVTDNGDGSLATKVTYENKNGAPFINEMHPGELTVSKHLENATGAAEQKNFEFQINLTDASGNPLNGIYDVVKSNGSKEKLIVIDGIGSIIKIKGNEKFTVEGLPHGAQYNVTELEAQGFELVSAEGASGTIKGGEEAKASFTNVYIATIELPLGATKIFLGGKIEENMFYFELLSDTGKVLETVAAGTDGKVEFSAIGYSQADVGNTFTYMIREVIDDLDGVKYDAHTETVEVTVSNDEDGNIILTANKNAEDIVFTNVALFDLDVSKTVTGTYGNQNREFNFILTMENDTYDLSDVRWSKGGNSDILRLDENGQYEFALKHDETISFKYLPFGTTYTIEEVKNGQDDDIYWTTIHTTISNEEVVVEDVTVTGQMEASASIEYINHCTIAELPEFGGAGTMLFYFIGIILMLATAGAWLYSRKHRRNLA